MRTLNSCNLQHDNNFAIVHINSIMRNNLLKKIKQQVNFCYFNYVNKMNEKKNRFHAKFQNKQFRK